MLPKKVYPLVIVGAHPEMCCCRAQSEFEKEIAPRLEQFTKDFLGKTSLPGVDEFIPSISLAFIPSPLMGIMTDWQRAWFYNGFYVQSGLLSESPDGNDDLIRGVFVGETVRDTIVNLSRSENPDDHGPLSVTHGVQLCHEAAVGDIYQRRVALHNSALAAFHSQFQVACRARTMDRDPRNEFINFAAADGRHFLDYGVMRG
jgi:hypothetical protein